MAQAMFMHSITQQETGKHVKHTWHARSVNVIFEKLANLFAFSIRPSSVLTLYKNIQLSPVI